MTISNASGLLFNEDEIHYLSPRPPVKDILGGAGTYAAIGARLISPPPRSKKIGWIVDAGSDFPPQLRNQIAQWQTTCLLRDTPWRKTTRGWNGYDANDERGFKYLTPKLRLDQDSLDRQLLASKSFHLICSPSRCIDLIGKTKQRRQQVFQDNLQEPIWIWEPVPDRCEPSELETCRTALRLVDVVSPNHVELCNFFGKDAHDSGSHLNHQAVETCCRDWVRSGIGSQNGGAVVVRAGKDGCCLMMSNEKPYWIPAYHRDSAKVVDPTGGGNSFLGGFGVCLARLREDTRSRQEHLREAVFAGSISASFAIEQVGLPVLEAGSNGSNELWNGEVVQERLKQFKKMVYHEQTQLNRSRVTEETDG